MVLAQAEKGKSSPGPLPARISARAARRTGGTAVPPKQA